MDYSTFDVNVYIVCSHIPLTKVYITLHAIQFMFIDKCGR